MIVMQPGNLREERCWHIHQGMKLQMTMREVGFVFESSYLFSAIKYPGLKKQALSLGNNAKAKIRHDGSTKVKGTRSETMGLAGQDELKISLEYSHTLT